MTDIQQAIEDLVRLEPTVKDYVKQNLDSLVQEEFLFEVIATAKASNLPKEFIDGILWIRTGDMSGRIVNTWGTIEEPLAQYFEHGTPDHWIEPNDPDGVLVFEATFGRNASAIFFMGNAKEGDLIFSKGHFVSGIPKTEAMTRGIATGWKRFKTAVLKNSKSHTSKELEAIV